MVCLFEQGRAFADEPFGNALQVETESFRHGIAARDAIAFLFDLRIACRAHITCQLRAYPAIFKGVALIDALLFPLLARLQDTRLQGGVDIIKAHRAKVYILDDQPPAMPEILAHSSKRAYGIGKILADVRAKNNI